MRYCHIKTIAALVLTIALSGCVDPDGYSFSYGENYTPGYAYNPAYVYRPGYAYPPPVYAAPPAFSFGLNGFGDRDDEDDDD